MRFHLIAIGGAVMHNLALALKEAGHQVTGSDDEVYDPSRTRLKEAGLLPDKMGWDPARITADIDQVILGKHARKDNPELHKALEKEIPIKSFPEFIYEMSKDKKRIVVGGSHGKTTTTSMIMHACLYHGMDIDFLVGAQLDGFNHMVRLSDAEIIVIEGDEYPSSALDNMPKFLHYKPHVAVITGIAWDHINIFPIYADYVRQFRLFIESIDDQGSLIYVKNDQDLTDILEYAPESVDLLPYGKIKHRNTAQGVNLIKSDGEEVPISFFGDYNMFNLAAAQLACAQMGIGADAFVESMKTFRGAAKRQQTLGEKHGKIAYLDFAHAPSKVRAATQSMIARYGADNIIVCLELHTFSSLSKQFLSHYKGSLNGLDTAMVFYSPHTIKMKQLEAISPSDVVEAFGIQSLKIGHESEDLEKFIKENMADKKVLLLMSSGKFGGLNLMDITEKFLNF